MIEDLVGLPGEVSSTPKTEAPKTLPGFIAYEEKPGGCYGTYYKNTFVKNGKVYHEREYLGRVINKEKGIFRNRARGYFTFSIDNGYGEAPDLGNPSIFNKPKNITLRFGDIWLVDQMFSQIGFDKIFEVIMPDSSDTLKSLVSFRLLEPDSYIHTLDWYLNSYASILYPNAKLDSPRISEFHEQLGQEIIYRKFFELYLEIITKQHLLNNQLSIPILIDSTGLQNDIKSHLTAINNHHGDVNNEIRLIYAVDKITKLPIFFRYVPGNIIDNSTFINTLNTLLAYNINLELIIMDAGYCSINNLIQLLSNKISFITRMTKNRTQYKDLLNQYGQNIKIGINAVTYGNRSFYGLKIPIEIEGHQLIAYLIHDVQKEAEDRNNIIQKYINDDDKAKKTDEHSVSAGKFILLSSLDLNIGQILPLYYQRQTIEQVFDVSKTYASLLPLRAHSEETLRGILLISFISTIIYCSINYKLNNSKFNAITARIKMKYLSIRVYESARLLEELTKDQKEIFKYLDLDCPFIEETGNKFKNNTFIYKLKATAQNVGNRKRGRPKVK
jgi:hypothetical protein